MNISFFEQYVAEHTDFVTILLFAGRQALENSVSGAGRGKTYDHHSDAGK